MRRGRDEVGARALEHVLGRRVTERDDAASLEVAEGDGKPPFLAADAHRRELAARALDEHAELGEDASGRPAERRVGGRAEELLGGRVPREDARAVVEHDDGVGDMGERACGIRALLRTHAGLLLVCVQTAQPLRYAAHEEHRDGEREQSACCQEPDRARERDPFLATRLVGEGVDAGLQRGGVDAEPVEELLPAEHVLARPRLAELPVGDERDLSVEVAVERADLRTDRAEQRVELRARGGEPLDLREIGQDSVASVEVRLERPPL